MIEKPTRAISRSDYLKGLGLLHLAQKHADKATEFADELAALMGTAGDGHMMDAVFAPLTLDEAMEREGITVAPDEAGS